MPRRLVVFAVIQALALSGCREGITRAISATVLSARGQIEFAESGSTNFRPLAGDTPLRIGTTLRTSSDGEVNLLLVPGALARISANSEMQIRQLLIAKDGNETGEAIRDRRALLELHQGKMVVLFEGFARFNINTPAVGVTVLPSCLFSLDVDQTRTRLTCVRGIVRVRAGNGSTESVAAGYFREWPSPNDKVRSASEDFRAEEDRISALMAASKLEELDSTQRNRLPIKR